MSTQVTIPDSPAVPVLPADPSSPPNEAQKQRQERKKSYGPILEYLKNTCRTVENEDQSAYLNILGQQNKCQAYYDDRQYGKINDRTGEWEDLKPDSSEFRPVDNKYKEQVDKLQMEMARSSVDLSVEPVDPNDSAMKEAAAFLKSRIDANRKRLFTQRPEFVLSENMSLLLKTITYRYVYFDNKAEDGPKERRPKFQKKALGEEKSVTVCAVCRGPRQPENAITPIGSMGGGSNTLPMLCPNCGSSSTKTLSTSPVELELPGGEEEVPAGLARCVHADPTMVKVSLNARNMAVSSSPYLIWTQMVEQGKLERMFPDRVIPSNDDDSDRQSEYRRDNESAVSNSTYSSTDTIKGGEQFRKRKFKLVWLDRWVYEDYSHDQPQKLPDGRVLPPNTPLVQFFPRGMCIAKVGDTPLALYSEDKNKKWSVCVYGMREHAFHGAGTNALLPIQLTINDLLAYRIANVYYNTNPREFFRPEAIDGGSLPTLSKACKVTSVDEGQRIVGNVYDRAPGTSLPPEVKELSGEQTGSLQEQAGTSSLSLVGTSAQSQALGTATGIAAMRDLAVGRMGPNLMLKAAMEVETAFQIAELEQNNYSKQQLMAFAGLRPGKPSGNLGYTVEGVEAFINSDIRADFLITPIPGSWMPATEQEKKADALAYADAAGKVQDPESLANLAKVFKQPLQLGGWNAKEREAARRIEEFGKVVELLTSKGYTETTDDMAQVVLDSPKAQMNKEMDNHTAFISFHKDWWVSDEARTAQPLLRRVVELRTLEHKAALVEGVAEANAQSNIAQIPNKVAQVVSNQIDAEQAQAVQGQQAEQQMMAEQSGARAEIEKQAIQNELNAEDREHEALVDAATREHEAALQDTGEKV